MYLDLTSLQLSNIDTPVQIPRFDYLRTLSLVGIAVESAELILDPETVPNLRHLALGDAWALAPTRLFPQLETICMSDETWSVLDLPSMRSIASRALVSAYAEDLDRLQESMRPIVHLRIHSQTSLRTPLYDVDDIVILAVTKPSLRSLYLHPCLHPSQATSESVRTGVKQLMTACKKRKIEIIFELGPTGWPQDSCISPEFVKRQKHSGTTTGPNGDG